MALHRIGIVAGAVALIAGVLAAGLLWLVVTQPVMVATALAAGF